MHRVVINIGDKVEMTHIKSASRTKLSKNKYGSMLLDYDGARKAKISMPIYEGRIVPLGIGDEYELCFFTSTSMYRCRAVVTKRLREGKMHVLLVDFLTLPEKFQRRQFYRLDCLLQMRFRLVSREEKALMDFIAAGKFEDASLREAYERKLAEIKREEWRGAVLTDISGGGIRLQCREPVESGSLIEVSIPLRMQQELISFTSLAHVVINVSLEGGHDENELRCEFENLTEEKQEQVVRFVFEEQKRRLKKD